MIVLDTSVMIDHLRRRSHARAAIRRQLGDGRVVAASVISRTEVLRGMRPDERRDTEQLFAAIEWLDVTLPIADAAGTLARRFRASHRSIDPLDFIIAATAIQTGAELWTHNVRHFPMFEDLTPPY